MFHLRLLLPIRLSTQQQRTLLLALAEQVANLLQFPRRSYTVRNNSQLWSLL